MKVTSRVARLVLELTGASLGGGALFALGLTTICVVFASFNESSSELDNRAG